MVGLINCLKIKIDDRSFFFAVVGCEESSLREGSFSRRSNLTTIATSVRIKIASFLAMTTILLESVNGSGV